ncbi:MAG: hypothetical protein JRC90_11985 [Deltaproteobacteria bacterium]|nr:hypothetical protein [Deltaproteobacteria bacterium]
MTLKDKMEEYRGLKLRADQLEKEIKEAIAESGQSAVIEGMEAVYKSGTKKYAYE